MTIQAHNNSLYYKYIFMNKLMENGKYWQNNTLWWLYVPRSYKAPFSDYEADRAIKTLRSREFAFFASIVLIVELVS